MDRTAATSSALREHKHPYRLIHDVYVLLDYGDRQVLNQFRLTSTQYRLLNLINSSKGRRLSKLGDRLIRSKSQLTRTIDTLEHLGYVQRGDDKTDGRAQLVVLTKKGEGLRERANKAHAESLDTRFSVLSLGEQEKLVSLLDKLRQGMAIYNERRLTATKVHEKHREITSDSRKG